MCIFMVGGILALLVLLVRNAYAEFAILCAPLILSLLAILLYFATWSITFTSDRVIKKVFFVTLADAPYSQIRDVVSARYTSLNEHVRIVTKSFLDFSSVIAVNAAVDGGDGLITTQGVTNA